MSMLFLINVILALIWAVVTGSFASLNLLFGFVLGALSLWMVRAQFGTDRYFQRIGQLFELFWMFIRELVLSSVRVAKIALTEDCKKIKPAFIAFPLTVEKDTEITLLANLISLTPGTLSVDISDDRKTLYIHTIDVDDVDQLRREIAEGFERKIMEALR